MMIYEKLGDDKICLINKLKKENEELKTEKQLLEFQETQLKNYIEELKKHDYRNIKIDKENIIKKG